MFHIDFTNKRYLELNIEVETDVAGCRVTVEFKTLSVRVVVGCLRIDIGRVLHDSPKITSYETQTKPLNHLLVLKERGEVIAEGQLTEFDKAGVIGKFFTNFAPLSPVVLSTYSNSVAYRSFCVVF